MDVKTLLNGLLVASLLLLAGIVCIGTVHAATVTVFSDNFNDNSLDRGKWTMDLLYPEGGNTVIMQNHRAEFQVYGRGEAGAHAFLESSPIPIDGWDSIDITGTWTTTSTTSRTYIATLKDMDDSSRYISTEYAAWDGGTCNSQPGMYYFNGDDQIHVCPVSRVSSPTVKTFRVHVTKNGFEYYEGGVLKKSVTTSILSDTTRFQLQIGAGEYSAIQSQSYLDDIVVKYTPETAPPVASEDHTVTVFSDDFNHYSLNTDKWTVALLYPEGGNAFHEQNNQAMFTVKGRGEAGAHAFLESSEIRIDGWKSIDVTGTWTTTSTTSRTYIATLTDMDDSSRYISTEYAAWDGVTCESQPGMFYYSGDTQIHVCPVSRVSSSNVIPFRVHVTKTGFEYWENGALKKSVTTSILSDTTRFQLQIGAGEYSAIQSQSYFDDIAVTYTPETVSQGTSVDHTGTTPGTTAGTTTGTSGQSGGLIADLVRLINDFLGIFKGI